MYGQMCPDFLSVPSKKIKVSSQNTVHNIFVNFVNHIQTVRYAMQLKRLLNSPRVNEKWLKGNLFNSSWN